PALAVTLARPLWVSGDRRNAAFPALLLVAWAANLAMHLDAAGAWTGVSIPAARLAVYVIVGIILVITGRVVPIFTRNTTGVAEIFGSPWLDRLAIAGTAAVALMTTVGAPGVAVVAPLAALGVAGRTVGWG